MPRFTVKCQDDDGWGPLHYAARYGHPHLVGPLLVMGADVNATTSYGWTEQNRTEKFYSW